MAVTLATTTLAALVRPTSTSVSLASAAGVVPGRCLYIDRELLQVTSVASTLVTVRRGMSGTATTAHSSSAVVTIGTCDQFYTQDPVGPPPDDVLVTPWINVMTGTQWTAQGDESGPNQQARWWAKTATTRDVGAMGVRTSVSAASSVNDY